MRRCEPVVWGREFAVFVPVVVLGTDDLIAMAPHAADAIRAGETEARRAAAIFYRGLRRYDPSFSAMTGA